MPGGPNRNWHIGDRGPSGRYVDRTPHAWCRTPAGKPRSVDWGEPPKPYGNTLAQHANAIRRAIGSALRSTGRDPHDHVTMELPHMDPPIPDDVAVRIAAGLYELSDDEVPWLLLMLKADSDYDNVLKRGPSW